MAHDIEVIRRALGEDRISFVGISYGTLLGQLWAEWYPTSVRALVLDGVVSPAPQAVPGGSDGAGRRGAGDLRCDRRRRAPPIPSCPLTDDGGLAAAYDELARRIEAGAVQGQRRRAHPARLRGVLGDLRPGDLAPPLGGGGRAGSTGDLSGIADLAGSFTRLVTYAPFAIVSCLDGPHPTGYDDWQEGADAYVERSPRFGRILSNELLPCAFWPEATLDPMAVDAAGAPPILVVGSTGDAATPYETAVAVADDLDSGVLLTVELDGHVAIGDSDCADAAITRYLVDLTVPAAGTRC